MVYGVKWVCTFIGMLLMLIMWWSCDAYNHITTCPCVVVLGDTCDNALIAPLCLEADVLVHEATNENEMQASAVDNGHSTPSG